MQLVDLLDELEEVECVEDRRVFRLRFRDEHLSITECEGESRLAMLLRDERDDPLPESGDFDAIAPSSLLHREEVRRAIGLMIVCGFVAEDKILVSKRLSPELRRRLWLEHEPTRLALAAHLARLPGVLIDWTREPMLPWRGLKFFHGTKYRPLQEGRPFLVGDRVRWYGGAGVVTSDAIEMLERPGGLSAHIPVRANGAFEAAAIAVSWLTHESGDEWNHECALSWKTLEKPIKAGVGGETLHLTAFTTPVWSKALTYGPHVHTYRLKKAAELRILDMRSDYATIVADVRKGNQPAHVTGSDLDPFAHISRLAGIEYDPARNRITKARALYSLFQHAGVADGAIFNTDLEWIWFDPSDALAFEPPPDEKRLANGDHAYTTIPSLLYNRSGHERDHTADILEGVVARVITANQMNDILNLVKPRAMRLCEVPLVHWTHDTADEPYMKQYLAGTRAPMHGLWT
ncbi:MAG: hypothetical protein Q7V62_06520, partial [Actinomycetota bacterium]|nr:hypothetical protein [Actinomycetota bacterium]